MRLRNKVAVVTGGGRGIGRAIALAFAREGAHLVLASRTLPEVEATAAEARALEAEALALRADVSQAQDVEAMLAFALAHFGKIDILVNNAAVQPPIGPLWENDPQEWLRTLLINLGGVFLCCRAVVPLMIRQGGGKIINLSGGGATSPRPCFSAYAASKAAVVRLTETLAEELKPFNVQVNAIAPGAVYTRMTEEVLAAGTAAGQKAVAEAARLKREGRGPEAAAELAVFLASEESNGLTGRLISAVWDDWRSIPGRIAQVMASDLYTLRRITAEVRSGGKA
jgi:NAD(P)-dependent dehydrogenase (short-subunit alcohol dehydrogenase family)